VLNVTEAAHGAIGSHVGTSAAVTAYGEWLESRSRELIATGLADDETRTSCVDSKALVLACSP